MRPDAAIDFDPRSQCLTPRLIQASAKLNPPPLALLASRRRLTHGTFHARRASGFHAAGNKRSRLDFLMRIDRFGSCIQPMSTRAKKPKRSSSPYQLGNDSRCGADRLHGSRSGVGFPTPIHPSSNCPREALASTPKPRAAPSLRAVNVCRQQESRHPATRAPGFLLAISISKLLPRSKGRTRADFRSPGNRTPSNRSYAQPSQRIIRCQPCQRPNTPSPARPSIAMAARKPRMQLASSAFSACARSTMRGKDPAGARESAQPDPGKMSRSKKDVRASPLN
jgi:hypothetical protein